MSIEIKAAEVSDAAELLEIYRPYVEKTAITFEYDVPSVEEFSQRIVSIKARYPYIKAEENGEILGYAYAGVFKDRAAYDWSVETTVYVKEGQHRKGIGRMLYAELERCLALQNITNLYACIACTKTEDEYLTNDSVRFHERLGYKLVGTFEGCAYKFGRCYDMVWLGKQLKEYSGQPPKVINFPEACKITSNS